MQSLVLKIDRSTIRKNPRFGEKFKYLKKEEIIYETKLEKSERSIVKKEYVNGELSSEVTYFGPPESQLSWKEGVFFTTIQSLQEDYEPEYLYTYIVPENYSDYDNVEFESIYEALASITPKD
jgi:hypothetical protein